MWYYVICHLNRKILVRFVYDLVFFASMRNKTDGFFPPQVSMDIQKWTSYCGLGIIGSCFRQRHDRPNQNEQSANNQAQPVILDTAHMGKIDVRFKSQKCCHYLWTFLFGFQIVNHRETFRPCQRLFFGNLWVLFRNMRPIILLQSSAQERIWFFESLIYLSFQSRF